MSGRKRSQAQITNLMKEELLKWLCIQHAINAPLDRNILRMKADELVRNFELTAFKCSESWLTIFLKRYSFLPNLAEGEGPVFDDYHTWINNIRGLINQYSYEDQYHLDELTMYTDFLPSSHLQQNEPLDAPVDMSALKLQLTTPAMHQTTLLLVSNATGTQKQNPLVSGPYPVQHNEKFTYLQNGESRISNEILSAWLFIFNRKLSDTRRRVILFMPRTRQNVLKLVRLTHVLPVLLPSKFPANLKPLRCDVSHFIKMSYRKSYVERLCTPDGGHWTPQEITEALVDAWNKVPNELIVSSFQRTKFREDQSSLTFEFPSWDDLQTGVPFQRFVTFDDDLGELEGPLRDDCRFLTKIKHEFNLKSSKIEGIIQSETSQPQPSTSREFNDAETYPMDTQRPVDDYVDDSEDDGGSNSIKSPVIHKIKIKNEIIMTGSNISQSSEEQGHVHEEEMETISERIVDEHVEGLSEGINSKIDHFSSTEGFNDKSDVIGNPIRRLFGEDDIGESRINDSVDPEVTMESLNSLSRGESTIIEEFDSTIDDDDNRNDVSRLIQSLDEPSVDSGVPDSSGETVEEKMNVDDEVESPKDTSTPKIHDLSIKRKEMDDEDDNCSGQVMNPLFNINNEDNSQEKVLDTSIEGAIITAKHFVDERIEYFVNETHQDDDKVPEDDYEGSINTSEASNAVDNAQNYENIEKTDLLEEKKHLNSEIEENYGKIDKDDGEIVDNIVKNTGNCPDIPQTVDNTEITYGISSPVVHIESQSSNLLLTTSEQFNPPQDSSPRPLNSSPVPDYHLDRSNCYSTESALQEASRELEEKLRDLEASDPSRRINFFDDEDTSESKQSNEAVSILRDFLNEAKEFKEFSDAKDIPEDDGNISYFKGLKRRRGEGSNEDPDGADGPEEKKQKIEDNWAKCFETFPVFGPYHFEDVKKETLGQELSAQIEVKSEFEGDKGSPGPSCSY